MREPSDQARITRFLSALGRTIRHPIRLYLVGGAAIVDLGLRGQTLDIDIDADADDPAALDDLHRVLPVLKDEQQVNVEWANPTEFLPIPRQAALERSSYRRRHGQVNVYHFDYASTALAKVARGSERDLQDIVLMVQAGIVQWAEVEALWHSIRDRPFGRSRQTPRQVEERMRAAGRRLSEAGLVE